MIGFTKRSIAIQESLKNYGKFLVNEQFHKGVDEVITEIAIYPNIKSIS